MSFRIGVISSIFCFILGLTLLFSTRVQSETLYLPHWASSSGQGPRLPTVFERCAAVLAGLKSLRVDSINLDQSRKSLDFYVNQRAEIRLRIESFKGNPKALRPPSQKTRDLLLQVESEYQRIVVPERARLWGRGSLNFNVGGLDLRTRAPKAPIDLLYPYFKKHLPEKLAPSAHRALDHLRDFRQVFRWFLGLRHEVIEEMFRAGARDFQDLNDPEIFNYFLDRVVGRRAQAAGFQVTPEGLPFAVIGTKLSDFFEMHRNRKIFYDFGASGAPGPENSATADRTHPLKGHAFTILYLAESQPDFLDLYEYIGLSADRVGVWGYLFDNPHDAHGPFFSGNWVEFFDILIPEAEDWSWVGG